MNTDTYYMPRGVRLRGKQVLAQCQSMMTFTELASAPSDPPVPLTDQLRLAVAAYLALHGLLPRAHRI